jgi:hypothetical protein
LAYREPETLTCPSCKTSGDIVWIIGEGPNTEPGQKPDYVDLLEPGIWLAETTATTPDWRGKISCPACAETVKQHPRDR